MDNIVLIGFMGAGKSTVGALAAGELGFRLIDLDGLIVERAGKSIRRVFSEDGETAFRDLESSTLHSLVGSSNTIIATGGGIVGREGNWEHMRRLGTIVYLRARWETLAQRIAGSSERPLADDLEKARLLFEKRRPLYESAALVIDTDGRTVESVVEELIRKTGGCI